MLRKKKMLTNLRQLRNEQGLSIEKLARAVGVTKETIRNTELGLTVPNVFLAMRIADIFNVKVEKLFLPIRKEG